MLYFIAPPAGLEPDRTSSLEVERSGGSFKVRGQMVRWRVAEFEYSNSINEKIRSKDRILTKLPLLDYYRTVFGCYLAS